MIMIFTPVSLALQSEFQCLNQDLETVCPKLAIGKFLDVLFLKGYHNVFK